MVVHAGDDGIFRVLVTMGVIEPSDPGLPQWTDQPVNTNLMLRSTIDNVSDYSETHSEEFRPPPAADQPADVRLRRGPVREAQGDQLSAVSV